MKKYFKRSLLQRAIFFLLPSSRARLDYLKKHNVFAELGDNCFYQCRKIPVEPQLVKIHNNVVIAADLHIIPHDVIHIMTNKIGGGISYTPRLCRDNGQLIYRL